MEPGIPIESLMRENQLLTQLIELYQKKNESQFVSMDEAIRSTMDKIKGTNETFTSLMDQMESMKKTMNAMNERIEYQADQQKDILQLYKGLHAKYILLLQKEEKEKEKEAPKDLVPQEVPIQRKRVWKCW
jgi:hypothetical protein